jgi:NAD(P)H-flavin reductase
MDWLAREDDSLHAAPAAPGADAEPGPEGATLQGPNAGEEEVPASPKPASGALRRPPTADGGVTVIECRQVTPELLIFKVPRPLDFTFKPGQSTKVGLGDVTRSYSIVSAPHEPVLEFFIELVPGGQMSERLRRLTIGDRVTLGVPKGSFLLEENYREHLMVATVTGINPFVSMVRDCIHRGLAGHRLHILHGASYRTEFGYRDELGALAAAHPDTVSYVPTVSRPDEPANAGWNGSVGRVDAVIGSYLEQTGLDSASTMLYACGHSGMINSVAQQYRPQGFQMKSEDYD